MSTRRRERALVRPHVVTGGRGRPSRAWLDVATVVAAVEGPVTGQSGARLHEQMALSPEKRQAMELCRGGALAVAEVAAHLQLPTSVTKVLLSDLLDTGQLEVLTVAAPQHDATLLKKVLDGLRALT